MTLKELLQKIQNRETSYAEAADLYLSRIKDKNKELNAFLYIDEKNVRVCAEAFDKNPPQGEASGQAGKNTEEKPLFGIPYAVKDNILAEGMQATAGSKILENYTAPYNATVSAQLKDSGAVVLGKTNLDEFAMGSSTENSAYGPTRNPHDISRVPGGSSGGSAAAVAAGLAPFALGSDTGGSIRQPAAFCGVVGFKPTYGAVSRYGLIAMASSLDQIGLFTKNVEDAKLVFPHIAKRDILDSTSQEIDPHRYRIDPKKLRIGIVKENFGEGLNERIKNKIYEALEVYKNLGVQVKEISLPHADYGLACYYIIMPSEASSNLARYDGIRYGAHLPPDAAGDLIDNYKNLRGDKFGNEVLRRIMLGAYTLSAGYYDAYYLKAQKVRTLIVQDYEKAFEQVDIIVSPTTPTLPFKFGEKTKNPLEMYLSDIYTVNANLAGVPAVSIPVGFVEEDGKQLPVGMQLTGPAKSDFFVLDAAEIYEKSK